MNLTKVSDPLLGAAKVVIILICIVLIFGMTMLGIGAGAILSVGNAKVMAELAKAGVPEGGFWLLLAAFGFIFLLLGIGYRFMTQLLKIVDSVAEGQPFAPENANRLSRMGWLALAGQAVILPLMGITSWFKPYADKAGHNVDVGFDLDLSTILLILVLFILARVFREGSAMRDELEGTV